MLAMNALYKRCIFHSHERSESHGLISHELSDHHLRWHGGPVDTRLYKFNTQRLSLYSLQYGDAVSIYPDVYTDFSLVHFSLRGGIEVQADGQSHTVNQNRAIISSPTRNINLQWSKSCEQLILRIPHATLYDAALQLRQEQLYQAIKQTPGLLLPETACYQWQMHLQSFTALESFSQGNQAYIPWLAHMELGMAMFLLLQSPGAHGRLCNPATPRSARASSPARSAHKQRRLDRLQQFAETHLTLPATLNEMAKAVALSERQLNALCHEHWGLPPMTWLRQRRLDAVRRMLVTDPFADLSAVAMLHGFTHLGRFAYYYHQRFGELPSQTIKSARNG